jgi:starch synthase
MLSSKVGGLGCCRRITKYQNKAGHLTRVVIPCYDTKFKKENEFECVHWGFVKLGKFDFHLMYLRKQLINGFELYLIEIPELFGRKDVYGYKDDIERFVFSNSY